MICGFVLIPSVGALLAEQLADGLDGGIGDMVSAALLAVEGRDGHAPSALAADAPVVAVANHALHAVVAPIGHPLHGVDGLVNILTELGHGAEPLLGGAEDDGVVAAPAVRILVLDVHLTHHSAGSSQVGQNGLVGCPHALTSVLAGQLGQITAVIHGHRDGHLRILLADVEVIDAVAASGVDAARAAFQRDVVILGDHVTQKGSYVCAGRARFDISHPKQITNEELRKAEDIVNAAVRKNYKTVTRIMTPDEAIKLGAMALFGEKYGETVRVVSMENDDEVFSRELCGGTHVRSTGDIGYFNIVSESAVAAGIRRVEFVTGHAAEKYAQDIEDKLHDISKILKTNTNDLEARINLLLEDKKRLETEILNLKKQFVSHKTADNQDKIETVNGIKFVAKQIDNVQAKELKAFVDEIKEQIKSGVIALFSCNEGKVSAVIGVTDDLTGKYSAVGLIKTVAPFIGANGGGGRPDMAQTGGAETSRINEAIEALRKSI